MREQEKAAHFEVMLTRFAAGGAVILKGKVSRTTAVLVGISIIYCWHFKFKSLPWFRPLLLLLKGPATSSFRTISPK